MRTNPLHRALNGADGRARRRVHRCELAEWHAEEDGLRDALLHRDHTNQYQQGPPGVLERYAVGLQDGDAVLRTAAVRRRATSAV